MGHGCAISVVVPTRNRSALLPRLVACLEEQQGLGPFEVIVVDDCSEDATRSVLHRLATSSGFPLIVAATPTPSGAGSARNVGWRMATGSVVAFTDDDCRPAPTWLAALVEAFDGVDIVQGRTTFDPLEARGAGPFSQVVQVERCSGQFETSNVAYRREVLEALGGFDEYFGADSFGEDVDLAWRALERGARARFASDAVVVHDVKRGPGLEELRGSVRAARRWRHIGRVLRDHPGYRPYRLAAGPFLARTHPPTLLALAGAILGAVRRDRPSSIAALLSVVPWLIHRLRVEPRPGSRKQQVAVLPATFVIDAVETLTVTWSGVRHRSWVL